MKSLLWSMALLICLIANPAGAQQRAPSKATVQRSEADPAILSITQMKPAIVQIRFESDSPKPEFRAGVAGTGFFVSPEGFILTAAHVITETAQAARSGGATKVEFICGMSLDAASGLQAQFHGSFDLVPLTVKEIDPVHDVALLQTTRNPFSPTFSSSIQIGKNELKVPVGVARLNRELPPEGQLVLVSGYPLSIPSLVTQRGMIASETFSLVQMQDPRLPPGVSKPEPEDMILLDAVVNPGNSGGPAYLPGTDCVVGIVEAFRQSPLFTNKSNLARISDSEFLTENSGLAVVTPIKCAIALLDRNKIRTYQEKNNGK
jgi:S1-C subfamily serine protease